MRQPGSLRKQSGPGTNINCGPPFNKDLINWSCRVLSNYKWNSVWHNCSEIAFLFALNQSSCFVGVVLFTPWILSASSNKNRKQLKFSCNFSLQICIKRKFHGNKGCHASLTTIKQGNQHAVPNRNPKHKQIETTIHYSFHLVHILTKNGENIRGQCIYMCI